MWAHLSASVEPVLHVPDGRNGTKFLSFCKNPKACPFSVVVFPADLKKRGDIRQHEGRTLKSRAQFRITMGEGAFLLFAQAPTDYDVGRRGRYSAGKFKRPKAAKKTHTKQGAPVSIEDPEEPQ